jgi:hypothetical protein
MSNLAAADRGVSEIIGFVLVFSLILGTISIVYVGGTASLDDARNAERVNNAERAFDVMANNFQQMGRGDAPNRATEIKLADAQLTTSTNRGVSVNANGLATAVGGSPITIRYDAPGDTRIVYEHGAVIREDEESAIMRKEPDWLFVDEQIVFRLLELRGANQGVGGGSSTALVRAETRTRNVIVNKRSSSDVTITVQTHPDRAEVWERYLKENLAAGTTTTAGSVTCTESTITPGETVELECDGGDTDALAVSKVKIDVTLT